MKKEISNTNQNKSIDELIESGQLSVMSECAYGSAIADTEKNNTLSKGNDKK